MNFHFLIGTTKFVRNMVAIFDFQDGRHAKTYFIQYLTLYMA